VFDASDPRHVKFVLSFANLIAVALNIPVNKDTNAVAEMAKGAKVPAYVPKKIEVKLEENKEEPQPTGPATITEDDDAKIATLLNKLEGMKTKVDKTQF